jgi:hypothetical protein
VAYLKLLYRYDPSYAKQYGTFYQWLSKTWKIIKLSFFLLIKGFLESMEIGQKIARNKNKLKQSF